MPFLAYIEDGRRSAKAADNLDELTTIFAILKTKATLKILTRSDARLKRRCFLVTYLTAGLNKYTILFSKAA